MHNFTRRHFLKLSALTSAALASAGTLTACAPKSPQASELADTSERTTDVLIVGAGIAGLLTAISAKKEGAGNVTIVEKLGMLGGSAVGSTAGIVVDSQYTPSDVDDSIERIMNLYTNLQSFSARESEYPNYDKVEYFFSETGKTYDLLKDQGAKVTDVLDNGTRAWYEYPDGPQAFMDSLAAIAEKLGVEILPSCAVEELVVEDGAVVGVVADLDGKHTIFNAPSTVLCSGGFGSNADMIKEYIPEVARAGLVNRGTAGATGECIAMAMDAGAAGFSDYWATISAGSITFSDEILDACEGIADLKLTRKTKQNIIVDSTGKRFSSESVPDQSVIACYMVLNATMPAYILYANPETELQALFDKGVEAGVIAKADTIADLELQMGMAAGALVGTVDAYNGFCAKGVDDQFGKPAEDLVAFEEGPFYALEFYTKMIGTMGGIQTNTDMRVLGADGMPIPGLLAAGEVTNRDLYNQIYVGGACIGIYSTMGRLAGITAAADARTV